MLKLNKTSKTFQDCTANYEVTLPKELTVIELRDLIIKERLDNWGDIKLKDGTTFGKLLFEYKYDSLTKTLCEDYNNFKVSKVTASGGWSQMHFLVEVSSYE